MRVVPLLRLQYSVTVPFSVSAYLLSCDSSKRGNFGPEEKISSEKKIRLIRGYGSFLSFLILSIRFIDRTNGTDLHFRPARCGSTGSALTDFSRTNIGEYIMIQYISRAVPSVAEIPQNFHVHRPNSRTRAPVVFNYDFPLPKIQSD